MRTERQRMSLFFCYPLETGQQASGSFGFIRERWLSGEGGGESLLLSLIVCHIPDFLLHAKETEIFISVDPSSGGICRDIWMSKQSLIF